MATALKSEPGFEQALNLCVGALRRIAEYEVDPAIDYRLRALGERKEWLDEQEHEELMSLVAFTEKRTIEKLEAQVALNRLGEVLPEVVSQP
jgi:hypothetical protein